MYHDKGLRHLFLTVAILVCLFPAVNLLLIYPKYQAQMLDTLQHQARQVVRHLARQASIKEGALEINFDTLIEPFLLQDFDLLKIKVFDRNGRVVYSTTPTELGKINNHPYFQEIVARGQEFSHLVSKEESSAEGEALHHDLVETYLPILDHGTFIGAFELYYDITHYKADYAHIYLTSLLSPLPLILAFLGLLAWLLKRLDRKIEQGGHDREEVEAQRNALLIEQQRQGELITSIEKAKRQWEATMDRVDDLVLMADAEGRVLRCNRAVSTTSGLPFAELLQRRLTDLFPGLDTVQLAKDGTPFDYFETKSGHWFAATLYGNNLPPEEQGLVLTMHDMTEIKGVSAELEGKNQALQNAYGELKQAQSHLLQQEKMASIGQLAAGVAHEINTPMGYISCNLNSLIKYGTRIGDFIALEAELLAEAGVQELLERQAEGRKTYKIDFILNDINDLVHESIDGCERVKTIVLNLKGFSRIDQATHQTVDIHECLDSTINIVWNELKYKTKMIKDYQATRPLVCFPQQLNQVFMNLLVNASHAIEKEGLITIKTWEDEAVLFIAISDNGSGIAPENLSHIFEPFFTTKEVGKGTGLGLSIVYDIVTKNHHGDILVDSKLGEGTTFTVKLPFQTT